MKKTLFIAAIACLLGTAYSYSVPYSTNNKLVTELLQKEKKTKLNEDDLPVTIKNLLKGTDYKDWKVDQAYLIEGASEYYKIELKKNDQKQTLNLDKYGNKVSVLES